MNFSFEINSILAIGIFLIIGLFGGFIARKIKFPTISGYIIVGVILSLLHIIPKEIISGELNVITDISLGVIGYLVGGGLYLKRLKQFGKNIAVITPLQAVGAWIFVTAIIAFLGPFIIRLDIPNPNFYQNYLPIAIVIGAVSCATAPAATLAIIREYRARGPFTTTLLAIIVLDDAIAIIAYAIGSTFANSLVTGFKNISWYNILIPSMVEIVGSILLGTILGLGLSFVGRYIKKRPQLQIIVLGTIFLCIGLSKTLGLSSLLANMFLGFVVVNRMIYNENMFGVIHDIEGIIFAMFFTLAGAHFDYGIIKTAGILAALIIIGRFSGKFVGASLGASISHASLVIKKYLGLALLPKAGVTVGLAMLIKQQHIFSGIENIMINAILVSVVINELIAPPLTKFALTKAGEIYKRK